MRRSAVVAFLLLAQTESALGQTTVEDSAAPRVEQVSPANPLPTPSAQATPSTPDPKAIRTIEPAPVEPLPKLRPGTPDKDQLSGHWTLGALMSYGTPLGNFTSTTIIGSRLGGALVLGLDLGYGLTRHLQLAVAGDWTSIGEGSSCADCSATSGMLGPRLRYHLVEGTRFSPWVGYGMSYRLTSYKSSGGSYKFTAVEPIRLEIGGDWYATSIVTVGPLLALGLSRTVDANDDGDHRWSAWLSAGLRIGFDPIGR